MIYEIRIRVDEDGNPIWQHDAAAELALNPDQRWTAQALHEAYHSVQRTLEVMAPLPGTAAYAHEQAARVAARMLYDTEIRQGA